jgi:hypothetical protein
LRRVNQIVRDVQGAAQLSVKTGPKETSPGTLGYSVSVGNDTGKAPGVVESSSRKVPAPRWCPLGLSKTQCRRLQKLMKKEIK